MEFNLVEEPWIRVMRPDCGEETVSLMQVFLSAHEYTGLAGELQTQNVAVLRMMLAVLQTVFYRWDENGEDAPIEEAWDAYDRWQALWEMGRFPEQPIRCYLEDWKDRFWLLDEKYPFYQVPQAEIGTEYTAAKLNGEISESKNKKRLFPVCVGKEKESLSYAEAARWLLYVNAFDDTSAKPKGKNLPSVGAGWLGKLGLIQAEGNSLFETLMLNLVLLDENEEPWGEPHPVWEREIPDAAERTEIPWPDNQAEWLTLQSRRVILLKKTDKIVGYHLLGGDFFEKENAFREQMTVWRPVFDKKKNITGYQPARHRTERKMWQDFAAIAAASDGHHLPGVVNWLQHLADQDCLDAHKEIVYRIAAVRYGDKDFFVEDVFEDSLSFHLNLLTELGSVWITRITDEVASCERLAGYVGYLAADLEKAVGGKGETSADRAREKFFFRVDIPFRKWLRTLDADQSDTERSERLTAWRQQAIQIAEQLGKELIEQAGPSAYQGRMVKESKDDPGKFISAPESFNRFQWKLKEMRGGQ